MTSRSHLSAGSLASATAGGTDSVLLTPERAGWAYSGLRVVQLDPGTERELETGPDEMIVLPLSATGVSVVTAGPDGGDFLLDGRASVFARVSDFAYVGRDTGLRLSSVSGGEVALCTARCDRRLPPRYGPADGVSVEIRGAGPATCQVTNFASPETWSHAERIMCVELDHSRRELVELPAAPPRRLPGMPGQQRGDLLLPHRTGRHHRGRARRLRAAPHLYPRRLGRRQHCRA